jgi:UDP-2-acetamido-2-deoxy-ribo-hexuluronate aminotransferase
VKFIDLQQQYQNYKKEIDAAIARVLAHGQFIMGPEVSELEEKLAEYTGAKYCITCGNGTDALLLAMMAINIQPQDEVIIPAFGYVAAAEMIVLLKAVPVFVDVEPNTALIDARQIENAISERTKAIIPISLYGQCADMDVINDIAGRYGLTVIEDAAQSFGATYKLRKSCNLSDIACTSFFPSKPLGCYGDGGACFTDNPELADTLRKIRAHGQERRYEHSLIGVNSRLDTIQAAILLAKLQQYNTELEMRAILAKELESRLAPKAGIETIKTRQDNTNVHAQFSLTSLKRDTILSRLKAKQIPYAIHYPKTIYQQYPYSAFRKTSMPASEHLAKSVFSIPFHPQMHNSDLDYIIETINNA